MHNREGYSTVLIKLVNGLPTLIDLDLAPEKSYPGEPFSLPQPYTYQGVAGYLSEYSQGVVETFANHFRVSRWRKTGLDSFSARVQSTGTDIYQDAGIMGYFSTDHDGSDPSSSFLVMPPTSSVTPIADQFWCRVITRKFSPTGSTWELRLPESGLSFVDLHLWRTGADSWGIKIETGRSVMEGDVGTIVAHTQSGTLHPIAEGSLKNP